MRGLGISRKNSALIVGAGLLMSSLVHANELAPIPSYQQGLEQFQAERAKSAQKPNLTDADKKLMADSAKALAAAMQDPGLKAGARAPDFTLVNAHGEPVTLSEMLQRGPVILTFYRGAWCPYCNLQLKMLRESLPHFQRHGGQLVAVTPQRPDKSLAQVEKDHYSFEILSDLDSAVMQAYGLYFEVPADLSEVYKNKLGVDLAEYNGEGRQVLPIPGTFVIDTRGIVRGAFADTDYRKRMEPAEIVRVLETMPSMKLQ